MVDLSRYWCKGYTSVVLGYSEVILFREREDASLCPSVIVFCGITVLEQYVVELPGLPYFWGYFIKPCCFPIFRCTCKTLDATILFVDFSKAYDSIPEGRKSKYYSPTTSPKERVTAIKMLFKNTKVNVKVRRKKHAGLCWRSKDGLINGGPLLMNE